MAGALKWKPQDRRVRLIFGDCVEKMDHVQKNTDKVFAVIGPFDHHADKPDLQDILEMVCRGYNLERT